MRQSTAGIQQALGMLDLLKFEGLPTFYTILGGLDECPHVSGVVPPWERALQVVEKLESTCAARIFASAPRGGYQSFLGTSRSLFTTKIDKRRILMTTSDFSSAQIGICRWRVEDKDRVTRKPSFPKSRDDNPHAFAAAVFDGSSANWERCVTAFHQ